MTDVDVWVGLFASSERLDEYLEEFYGDDDAPLSEFARDMNERFYDHDFLESSFHEQATEDVESILRDHSLSSSCLQLVVEAFETAPKPGNAALLMWNEAPHFQIGEPKSVRKDGVQLRFLGRFECK